MIDTENKRRSVIEVPGISELPVANASVDSRDRAMVTSIYSGIAPTYDPFFFWRNTGNSSGFWVPKEDSSGFMRQKGDASSVWTKMRERIDS